MKNYEIISLVWLHLQTSCTSCCHNAGRWYAGSVLSISREINRIFYKRVPEHPRIGRHDAIGRVVVRSVWYYFRCALVIMTMFPRHGRPANTYVIMCDREPVSRAACPPTAARQFENGKRTEDTCARSYRSEFVNKIRFPNACIFRTYVEKPARPRTFRSRPCVVRRYFYSVRA